MTTTRTKRPPVPKLKPGDVEYVPRAIGGTVSCATVRIAEEVRALLDVVRDLAARVDELERRLGPPPTAAEIEARREQALERAKQDKRDQERSEAESKRRLANIDRHLAETDRHLAEVDR